MYFKILAILIIISGLVLFSFSCPMKPYENEDVFRAKYMLMNNNNDLKYIDLRNQHLTVKYRMQDTGISLIFTAIWLFLISRIRNGQVIMTPSVKHLKTLSYLLPMLSIAGMFYSFFYRVYIEEIPWWDDSMAKNPLGYIFLLIICYLWVVIINTKMLKNGQPVPLKCFFSTRTSILTIVVSALTLVSAIVFIYYGNYWFTFPALCWLYLYMSIGAINNQKWEN